MIFNLRVKTFQVTIHIKKSNDISRLKKLKIEVQCMRAFCYKQVYDVNAFFAPSYCSERLLNDDIAIDLNVTFAVTFKVMTDAA